MRIIRYQINTTVFRTMLGMLLIRGGAVLLALWVQIWLVAQFGASAYGEYVFFVTVSSLMVLLSKGGLDTLMLRKAAVGFERNEGKILYKIRRDYMRRGFIYSTIACGISGVAYVTYSRFAVGVPHLNWGLLYVATQGVVLFQILLAFSRAIEMQTLADGFDALIRPALMAIAALLLSKIDNEESVLIISSYIFSFYIALYLLYRSSSICRSVIVSKNDEKYTESYQIREHLSLLFVGLLGFVFFQMDTLVLGLYVDSVELGAYNMACNLVRIVIFIPMILAALIQPRIAIAFDLGDVKKITLYSFMALMFGLCAAVLCWLALLLLGPTLLNWINPDFIKAKEAMMILAMAHVINAVLIIIAGILSMLGRHRELITAQVTGALVTCSSYFLLIPIFKERGAAFAVLVGLLTILGVYFIMFRKFIVSSHDILLRKT